MTISKNRHKAFYKKLKKLISTKIAVSNFRVEEENELFEINFYFKDKPFFSRILQLEFEEIAEENEYELETFLIHFRGKSMQLLFAYGERKDLPF